MTDARPRRVRRPDVRRALLIGLLLGLVACASGGQRSLRNGNLRPGIGQKAVLSEWGLPERTLAVVSAEQLRSRWGTAPEVHLRPDRLPLDLWMYDTAGVELVFDDGDLVAWKTDRDMDELRALVQPQTTANPYPAGSGKQSLEQGLLRVDIGQKAFRERWGHPDRVVPVEPGPDLETKWGPEVRGSVLEGRRALEIWVYERYGVELLFCEGDLAAWKTRKTTEELRALLKRP